ncbi:hypothetical protein BU14_0205s0010 [Porphyra umbilicalis]|uniref:No apical meristem-associated C-terminal domain-containing protein n=1 Tax=Porphyra umbilicalis TaxID=2786 RepID=A0A1X6P5W4_PORUM|nr:hypothetical protein BU14_0205s0010 [Porphyra umbilicalis]|eukprot:OSX76135.1 hypothetical protein BU14_0205s0010 [Porphyra umbilicalis]
MPNTSGRLLALSALLSVDDDAGTTQTSQVPDSRTTPAAASSAVVTQPPFSSPPRPLYLQRPSRDAARALDPFCPDPVMGGSNQSTDARTSLLHDGATPGVGQARNVDNPFPVFAGDTQVAHTNLSDDVQKWWAKFVDAQLSSDGASKQLSLPNAAGWVTKRLAKKKNNPLQPLKYDAVYYMMDTMRSYMTERAKIKHHSTGKSPRSIAKAQKQKDVKKAADWRMSMDEMDQLVKMATGVLQHTGGTCKTTPFVKLRLGWRRTSSQRPPTPPGPPCPPPRCTCIGYSPTDRGRSRRSLTADEDGRAALEDDGAIRAIVESTRSAASARATQADLAKNTFEMQAAAATRAAEATLAAANRQFQLDMMRERRKSRESDRRTRVAEQQAMAAVLTAQATLPVEKLRVLKDLYLETRDVAILQQIAWGLDCGG